MHDLVRELADRGIQVTIVKNPEGDLVYDLDAQTKSGMYMSTHEHGPLYVTGRYNENDVVSDLTDLARIFAQRYRARAGEPGFGNPKWLELAVEYGALERKEKVIVEYV